MWPIVEYPQRNPVYSLLVSMFKSFERLLTELFEWMLCRFGVVAWLAYSLLIFKSRHFRIFSRARRSLLSAISAKWSCLRIVDQYLSNFQVLWANVVEAKELWVLHSHLHFIPCHLRRWFSFFIRFDSLDDKFGWNIGHCKTADILGPSVVDQLFRLRGRSSKHMALVITGLDLFLPPFRLSFFSPAFLILFGLQPLKSSLIFILIFLHNFFYSSLLSSPYAFNPFLTLVSIYPAWPTVTYLLQLH